MRVHHTVMVPLPVKEVTELARRHVNLPERVSLFDIALGDIFLDGKPQFVVKATLEWTEEVEDDPVR